MSNSQTLFAALLLFYAADCLLWLDRRSVAFVLRVGRRWRAETASSTLGTPRRGLIVLNPFPPLGRCFVASFMPFSVSPSRAVPCGQQAPQNPPQPPSGPSVEISDIRTADARDSEIWLNGRFFCECSSSSDAMAGAGLLRELSSVMPEIRPGVIEKFWESRMSPAKVTAALQSAETAARLLRPLCIAQFLYLFVALPLLALHYSSEDLLAPCALVLAATTLAPVIAYFRAHARRHPSAPGERVSNSAKMLLCPPSSVRAADLLTCASSSGLDPLALGSILLENSRREMFVESVARDLRHPVLAMDLSQADAAVCRWQNLMVESVAARQLGKGVLECLRNAALPPSPSEPSSKSYCPRCRVQLSVAPENSVCPDCPGVGLKPLAPVEDKVDEVATQHQSAAGHKLRDENCPRTAAATS